MPTENEFRTYLAELLAPLGPISFRRIFSAVGVLGARGMFGLIVDETLYFKVTDESRADYEAAGMSQITYERASGREVGLPYFEVPDELLDEPERFLEWAEKAFAAAVPARRRNSSRRRLPRRAWPTPRA